MLTTRDNIFYFIYLHRTGLTVTALSVLLLIWPLVESNPYNLVCRNLIAIYAIVVLGLNLFIGYAGQISLGHAAFFAMGAYGSAIGTTTLGGPAWPVMTAVAMLAALPSPWRWAAGPQAERALPGHGHPGIQYRDLYPSGAMGCGHRGAQRFCRHSLPCRIGPVFDNEIHFHYLVWTFAMLALLSCLNLVRSGAGRGLAALAEDETAAALGGGHPSGQR
jgi:branched-chain amino acid transport system permease protein